MTDWNLVGWLLNFDFLIAYEFALLNLEDKLAFHHVFNALLTRAFEFGRERFRVYGLVDFKSTSVTSIYSNLHAWLHVTASGYNTFNRDHSSNRI